MALYSSACLHFFIVVRSSKIDSVLPSAPAFGRRLAKPLDFLLPSKRSLGALSRIAWHGVCPGLPDCIRRRPVMVCWNIVAHYIPGVLSEYAISAACFKVGTTYPAQARRKTWSCGFFANL